MTLTCPSSRRRQRPTRHTHGKNPRRRHPPGGGAVPLRPDRRPGTPAPRHTRHGRAAARQGGARLCHPRYHAMRWSSPATSKSRISRFGWRSATSNSTFKASNATLSPSHVPAQLPLATRTISRRWRFLEACANCDASFALVSAADLLQPPPALSRAKTPSTAGLRQDELDAQTDPR